MSEVEDGGVEWIGVGWERESSGEGEGMLSADFLSSIRWYIEARFRKEKKRREEKRRRDATR